MEDIYFDELFELLDRIRKKRVNEYMMGLAIVQNPHLEKAEDRRALWDKLQAMFDDVEIEEKIEELDKTGFESFKSMIMNNSRVIVK